MAANMLRIIRGAGKPYELLPQMKKVIDSAIKFQELHGYWPLDVITSDLLVEDEMETFLARCRAGTTDQATIDRWWKDGTFDRMMAEHTMYRGALQAIASELIGQNMQKLSGESEFHEGLRQWMKIREERVQKERKLPKPARQPRAKESSPGRTSPQNSESPLFRFRLQPQLKYSIAIVESHQVSAAAPKMQTSMARK